MEDASAVRHVVAPLAVAALALALLAGCTPETGAPDDPGDPAPSGDPERPTRRPNRPTQPVGAPVDVTCDELVSADTLYSTTRTSARSRLQAGRRIRGGERGRISGRRVPLAEPDERRQHRRLGRQLDEDTITALKNAAFEDSEMVPTYGEEAYFGVDRPVGTAQVFQGPYWIVAESPVFFEPGDAAVIVHSVIAALP